MARLLVFEPRMLGDAILSLPFVRGAMEQHEVTVCCLPKTAPIYRWILPPERIIEWEVPWDCTKSAREKWVDFRRVTQQVRGHHFDTMVSVWPDARVHIWMALLGIPQRVSFPMTRNNYYAWQQPWRRRSMYIGHALDALARLILMRPLLTEPLQKEDSNQSHLQCWKQLAQALRVPFRCDTPWLAIPTLPTTSPLVSFVVNAKQAGRSVWMIHPGARVASKQWPRARFQKLADDYFPNHSCSLVMLCPPDTDPLRIRREHQIAYAAPTLDELASAISLVDGLLCNDSMASHLAAALGKRVVSLFGPSQISWFAPFANEQYVVSVDVCPYRPCMDHCVMPSPICIEQIECSAVEHMLDLARHDSRAAN